MQNTNNNSNIENNNNIEIDGVINTRRDIQQSPFYVTAIDAFMSGWGCARGKKNKLVFPCTSIEVATSIEFVLKNRSEMKRVHFSTRKPTPNKNHITQQKDPMEWLKQTCTVNVQGRGDEPTQSFELYVVPTKECVVDALKERGVSVRVGQVVRVYPNDKAKGESFTFEHP